MVNSGIPVIVRKVMPAKTDNKILQVEFYQNIPKPITDRNSLLNLLMEGHKAFGPTTQPRVAYQNMYIDAFNNFGLDIGKAFPEEFGAELVIHEFCTGDIIPVSIRGFYDKAEHFKPSSWIGWKDGEAIQCSQEPKKTPNIEGRGQITMTRNSLPIYRNTFFTINTMDQTDYLITHDNISQSNTGMVSNSNKKVIVSQVGSSIPR